MTLGVTGVIWLPRTATVNSTALAAGAGPAPLTAASAAWTALAAAYTDASVTVGRVMATLAAEWEGASAAASQSRLGPFLTWANQTVELAAESAQRAGAQAAAYTTALAAMPSIPEIAAVKTAKAAAYSTGGAVNGSAAATEAADLALDIRAALVMEAYEAATSVLATGRSATPPPQIVAAVGPSVGTPVAPVARYSDAAHDVDTRPDESRTADRAPAQTVASSVESWVQQNPNALSSTANTVGSSAQSVASTANQVANQSGSALFAPGSSGPASADRSSVSRTAWPVTATRAAAGSLGAAGAGGAFGTSAFGGLVGRDGTLAPTFRAGPGSAATPTAFGSDGHAATAGFGSAAAAPMRPFGALYGAPAEDDDVHERTYDDRIVQFDGGATVVPSVIGSDPAQSE